MNEIGRAFLWTFAVCTVAVAVTATGAAPHGSRPRSRPRL